MIIVSNTTPLIGMASIDRFSLLQQMFGEIIIPQAVYDESVSRPVIDAVLQEAGEK